MAEKIVLAAIVASVLLYGCGPSAEHLAEKERIRQEQKAKEAAFMKRGIVITDELATADGVIRTIEIPIKDDIGLVLVKRCTLFVARFGSQTMSCEEPDYKRFD